MVGASTTLRESARPQEAALAIVTDLSTMVNLISSKLTDKDKVKLHAIHKKVTDLEEFAYDSKIQNNEQQALFKFRSKTNELLGDIKLFNDEVFPNDLNLKITPSMFNQKLSIFQFLYVRAASTGRERMSTSHIENGLHITPFSKQPSSKTEQENQSQDEIEGKKVVLSPRSADKPTDRPGPGMKKT